jgi:hypothetical protein
VDGDWDLMANQSGATGLGFSLLLKFFELEGRFPDVLENWNSANTVLHYGKDGALTGPDKEHAETLNARPAPAPVRTRPRQHLLVQQGPRRTGVGIEALGRRRVLTCCARFGSGCRRCRPGPLW